MGDSMTWIEFKQEAERQGLKDTDTVPMINWKDYTAELTVVEITHNHKVILRPEKAAAVAEADAKGLLRPSVDC
jgi:thioesterase domain-containing protein